SGSSRWVRAEPKIVTLRTSLNGANIANASRISATAALAILRSSVSGLSVSIPAASAKNSSAIRTSLVMPSSAISCATRGSAEFDSPSGMRPRLYGSIWHGVAIGLLATFAGLAAGELIAGLFRQASSPVLPVGQEVIDAVPRSVKEWAIEQF